jgi:hypothetical protein
MRPWDSWTDAAKRQVMGAEFRTVIYGPTSDGLPRD